MLTKKEIEKRLKGVDPQRCIAFALRCSLRALPLLLHDQKNTAFDYWPPEKRSTYLLALFRAQQFSINISALGRKKLFSADAYAAAAFAASSYASAASAAASASASAAYAASASASASSAVSAAYAASAASSAKIIDSSLYEKAVLTDLDYVCQSKQQVQKFLYTPLWTEKDYQWQKLYTEFKQALLDLNQGFDIWVDWYTDRVNGVPLDFKREGQWLDLPKEVLQQGAKASNAYLTELLKAKEQNIELKPLNLIRTIFIGNGAAGKTSLIRRLHNEVVKEGKEEMTPGIDIRPWSVPNSDIKARFWDFGGQVMSHATHQFFLRQRCLYVLVIDAGNEHEIREDKSSDEQAEYWLEHIKAFGKDAPVMLVGNKADHKLVKLSINRLKEKYPNILLKNNTDIYPMSCTKTTDEYQCYFETFKTDLSNNLMTMVKQQQILFTDNQFIVLDKIRGYSRINNFLNHTKFDAICEQHQIGEVGMDKDSFLGVLDNLGEVIHFEQLRFNDAYVLNPRWLTYGVYTILYSKQVKQQMGVISDKDVVAILASKNFTDEIGTELQYPKEKCAFIINAMEQFKLCYRIPEDHYSYVIPDRLPEQQPDLSPYFDKNIAGTLAFEFDFLGMLPRNIMPNIIVSRHKDIKKDNNSAPLQWQNGVLLYNQLHGCTTRIQVDYTQRKLNIWIQGNEPREYLLVLKELIESLIAKIKGLTVNKYVYLPADALLDERFIDLDNLTSEKAPYDRLIAEAKNQQKTTISDSGRKYDLSKVLGHIITDTQLDKELKQAAQIRVLANNLVIGDGTTVNQSKNTTTINNASDYKKFTKIPWWVFTLIIAVVCGLFSYFVFKSGVFSSVVFIITTIVVHFFNPKRRFFRAANYSLSVAFFNAMPLTNYVIQYKQEFMDGFFGFVVNKGDSGNPWLVLPFILLSISLYVLDYKENKLNKK